MSNTRPDSSAGEEPLRSSDAESRVGSKVGKYEIVRVIGRGGMGMVYEALNTAISKRVAMKFVDAEMARNKDAVTRFQREAQAASAVESAHIVEIFDSGISEDGLPFIVMELLRGEDLGHRIKRNGRIDLQESLHVVAQILRGLHRAHEAGIVHRDLKPDNIFLVDRDDDPNFAKVLDFGISKMQRPGDVPVHTLTRQGTVLGTPFYMSPEQAQALSDIDGRTDLWSVGAILYECLTGRPPYNGQTYEQVIINICMKDAEDVRAHNPGVPDAIATVLKKALCRERETRYQNAREFLDSLVNASGGLLSSRQGARTPEESGLQRISNNTPSSVPASTPHATPGATGYEPTLEVQQNQANVSRVGWATSGGALAARRDRRKFVAVAIGALFLGGLGAYVAVRSQKTAVDPPQANAISPDLEIHLKSNAPNCKYTIDGKPIDDGVVKGAKGASKTVHVEAEGFVGQDVVVTMDPSHDPFAIALSPTSVPVVAPAETAEPIESHTNNKTKPVAKNGGPPKITPVPTAKPSETVKAPTPPPQSTGVAGELKLKTD